MECLDTKEKIENFARKINQVSYEEKRDHRDHEAYINHFLDKILSFKEKIVKLTDILESLTVEFEKLTWIQGMDEECIVAINDLVASSRDFYLLEIKFYVSLETIKKNGIGKDEIRNFKMALDDFKESYEDLEEVFVLQSHKKEIDTISKSLLNFK